MFGKFFNHIWVIDLKTGKLLRGIEKNFISICNICKSSSGDFLYYREGNWNYNHSNLVRFDNKNLEESSIEIIKSNPDIFNPNISEFHNDTIFFYELRSTYEYPPFQHYADYKTYLYFKSNDVNTGREVEQGRFELPYYYEYVKNILSYFYEGNLYLYLPNEQILITNKDKHVKLNEDIHEFIIHFDKVIAIPKEQPGINLNKISNLHDVSSYSSNNVDGDLLVLDLNTGKKVKKIKAHNRKIELIKQFGDNLVTMTGYGEIKIWDTSDFSLITTIQLPQENNKISLFRMDIDIDEEKMIVLFGGKIFIYE